VHRLINNFFLILSDYTFKCVTKNKLNIKKILNITMTPDKNKVMIQKHDSVSEH